MIPAPRDSDAPIVRCASLEVGHQGKALLPPVDFEIRAGEVWAVVGRNGAGKSTLLRTLLGLETAVRGRVEWRTPPPRLSYLGQESTYDAAYPLSVREVVRQGAERGWSFVSFAERRRSAAAADAALTRLGLRELQNQPFFALSIGQRQRVLFARLSASAADLAVLDEPTSAMDAVAEREAVEQLARLQRGTSLALVVVSHQLDALRRIASHALFLDRGVERSAEGGRRDHEAVAIAGPAADVFADRRFVASFGTASDEAGTGRA